jgi:hypothetical protein
MSLWTIYHRPADYPNGFVARRFEIHEGYAVATGDMKFGATLDAVRDQIPQELYRIERSEDDDPVVVETWL